MDSPSICSISLHHSDLLRLHNFPHQLYVDLRQTLQISWVRGIQEERDFHSSKEFKLKGNPWSESWHPVEAIKLALRILEFMATRGWNLLTVTSMGAQFYTKDTWVFQFNGQVWGAAPIKLRALSFHGSDKIRVVEEFPSLAKIVEATVQRYWLRGLQDVRSNEGMPEFKLRGTPWISDGKENDELHGFLIALMGSLTAQGFKFLASVRITHTSYASTAEEYLPLDTWILLSP